MLPRGKISDSLLAPTDEHGETVEAYSTAMGEVAYMRLRLRQQKFVDLYTTDVDCFGDGAGSYSIAYGCSRMMAKSSAHKLLCDSRIIAAINYKLAMSGFSDENVDRQHLFLVNQFADLKTKLAAVKHYNELTGRVVKRSEQKHTHEVKLSDVYREAAKKTRAMSSNIVEGEVVARDTTAREKHLSALTSQVPDLPEL